jgi:hypothetical protein
MSVNRKLLFFNTNFSTVRAATFALPTARDEPDYAFLKYLTNTSTTSSRGSCPIPSAISIVKVLSGFEMLVTQRDAEKSEKGDQGGFKNVFCFGLIRSYPIFPPFLRSIKVFGATKSFSVYSNTL